MKWLWIVLGLFIVGAAIILWQDAAPSTAPAQPATTVVDRSPVRPSRPPANPASDRTSNASAKSSESDTTAEGIEPLPPGRISRTTTDLKKSVDVAAPSTAQRPSAPGGAAAADLPPRALPTIENATVVAGSLERQDDGSIIADKRFRITGSGTQSDPYRVSWECLASAQETYIPRLSETKLPERIAMLDGKFVRMDGYVSFPLLQKESNELILMLNQWDGCCIGVPPTPYDAIEVKLAEVARNTRRHASFTYGSVTGIFKVEPFLVENWLVGLYLLEQAHYEAEGL